MIEQAEVNVAFHETDRRRIVERMWGRDHTLWKPDPTEISNRLGWLTVTDAMSDELPDLKSFARDIRSAGFRHVVLLGMGGSSLGAEVLGKAIGPLSGYPELIVLDSTLPEAIRAVEDSIDITKTLFLISSKSGSTIEPLTLYRYFRSCLESLKFRENAGDNFVAITDAGTPLDKLARDENFRRVFLNPEDLGGRYSVLSYFGLVPAALLGIDIEKFIERADAMQGKCRNILSQENPGAWLGTIIGTLGRQGKNKLTLITSPSLISIGFWVEQLIAESTGKEGRGIVPVAGEPVLAPEYYGDDRLFVYFRLATADNRELDESVALLKDAGQPVVAIDLDDSYDLGGEFYRWEFAVAVAAVFLGINPFDQPDVEGAKAATQRVLGECIKSQMPCELKTDGNIPALFNTCQPGDYLSIMAYVRETPETDRVFTRFRRHIAERYHIATTLGYGPRFLHSTGQLYKGGPNTGLFIQITAAHTFDVPVPGKPYTFTVLSDAEAIGDKEALQAAGRRVISIHLNVPEEDIAKELATRLTY
jgi:glucose-6-phosphate isomerase/transaldolase/glucose-6-phosphate isomerase